MKTCATLALLGAFSITSASAADFASVQYDSSTKSIVVKSGAGDSKQCTLSGNLKDVVPKFNWNRRVVLLTAIDYVSVADIAQCSGGKVAPSSIPQHVGFVVDVNLQKKLYLSLDAVTAGPITYAATVAKLGSTHPLGRFPGEYTRDKSWARLQEEGFDDADSGRISADGRYVSADGSMACTIDSHPGVWDLQTGQSVVRPDGCESLFDPAN